MIQLPRGLNRILLLAAILTLVAMVFFPEICWARSGSYRGGGGHIPTSPLVYYIGISSFMLLVIAAILMSFFGDNKSRRYQEYTIRCVHQKNDCFFLEQGLHAIEEHDPNFKIDAFCRRVSKAFRKVQKAWSKQQLSSIRPFVSDGIYERFSLQIEEQLDLGYRNIRDKVQVMYTKPLEVVCSRNKENSFEVISVKVCGTLVNYRVSSKTGKGIPGSRSREVFDEIWTFIRRSNAQTPNESRGLIEVDCPNCGQSISLSTSIKCESCGSLLRSGEHDWVLSEITQAGAYRLRRLEGISSAASYWIEHDPSFNSHHLEDRASVIYWRKVMADRKRDIAPLNKMAIDQFCDQYESQLSQTDPSLYPTYGDCEVRSVELIGMIPDNKMDQALVSIRWSGKRWNAEKQLSGQSCSVRSLLVLGRNYGVKTKIDQSVSSSHCYACSAPEENLSSHACEFCGEVLNDGSQDWVLLEFLPFVSEAARSLIKRANEGISTTSIAFTGNFNGNGVYTEPFVMTHQTAESVTAGTLDGVKVNGSTPTSISLVDDLSLVAWVIAVAAADGKLDEKEKKMFKKLAANHGVTQKKLQELLHEAGRGELEMPEATNKKTGKHWLQAMVDMALIDGKLDQCEKKLISQTGKRLGLCSYDIKQLVRKRRSALFDESKQIIKNMREQAS